MLIILCTFIIILLYVYVYFTPQSRSIDQMFPGPPRLPFLGTISLKMLSQEGLYEFLLESAKSYNYLPYRIWLMNKPYVMVPDFKLARVILSKLKFTDKADFYEGFVPWLGRNHLVGSGEAWLRYRKHDLHAFRYHEVIQYIQLFSKNCVFLCQKLSAHDGKEAFDVANYISKYSLDNICGNFETLKKNNQGIVQILQSTLGTRLKAQNSDHCPYADALETMTKIIFWKTIIPILRLNWIFNLTPLSRRQKDCIKIFRAYSEKIIREKKAAIITNENKQNGNGSNADATNNEVTSFIDRALKLNKANYTDEEIQIEIESAMFAGHDTGTSTLGFVFYSLAQHQGIQEKVYEELRYIFGNSTDININQLNQMKYSEQVIKETLRYYSALPAVGRHIKENLYINEKQFIPKDTNVIINLSSIHRDPINWPNPDIFDPDRFSPESSRNRDPYAFLAFSAGPRNCLGYHMAMTVFKVTIARVIKKFKLSLSDNPQHKIRPAYNILLTSDNGVYIKIKSRN